ncbi:class I SAM-dependent methyltransferase [Xanthomonas sacchari]|uniref:Trans-aconitate 2-methyltransferase n=1 Tax=Xanthomonas sacchari TaxID=56458 RepID=A0ABT3DU80_9XANT|nr:class I SAM-dependent methyltransferase [Xanthomonas sacchari]MCW0377062.1 Trans-aconitate 2-methyltransferase [Xanthomonas sacchari]MCW0387421.1 Trans-aconitate 2-methyltransferase [Xanthomonas sacchari]MCW0398947.1 Trans-aconitate 2-methyltransferase [Xanthomonas sacchari]MCW0418176.1 Trans-aconitate 2-methyltransferase [Xanthomonas sacchari]UYK73612.1 class I SAM-dependent methyltransferase [Xanthomonas sacchari]
MRDDAKPYFDKYADKYRDLHAHNIKSSGEDPDYFAAYKVRFIKDYVTRSGRENPSRFMDFGCGVGGTIGHLVDHFPHTKLHGFDVSGESIALARETHPKVQFSVIEGDCLPEGGGPFDMALAACVYHHIQPAQRALWTKQVFNRLKPGGLFFIFEHNPLNPLTLKAVRECPFDDDAILLPKRESVHLMREAGFQDVRVDFIVFFPRMLAWMRPLERLMTKIPIGAQYAVIGHKPLDADA